jgi:hypothetical protein
MTNAGERNCDVDHVVADCIKKTQVLIHNNPYAGERSPIVRTLTTMNIGCAEYGHMLRPTVREGEAVVELLVGQQPPTMTPERLRAVIYRVCGVVAYEIVALFKNTGVGSRRRPAWMFSVVVQAVDEDAVLACTGRVMCFSNFMWLPPPGICAHAVATILKKEVFVNWGLLNVMVPNHRQLAAAVDAATKPADFRLEKQLLND